MDTPRPAVRRRGDRLADAIGAPAVTPQRVLGRTTGLLYVTGGLLVLLASLSFDGDDPVRLGPVRLLAAAAVVIGAVTAGFRRRLMSRGAYHLLVVGGTGQITAAVVLGGGGEASIAFAILYVFVVVDASFFLSWAGSLLHLLVVLVSGTAAMLAVGVPGGVVLMQEGSLVIVSLAAGWLARVADAAERDPLTRLTNRRGFEVRLERTIDRLRHARGTLTLVRLDLDTFKAFNDVHGPAAGDRVLVAAAERWQSALEGTGVTLSRYGGDEFAVALPGWSLGRAADLADELRLLTPDGVTASAGVAAWQPGDTASTLTGRADVALYDAKCAGRDRTVVHGDPDRAASEIEAAVARGEMVLHFQPVVSLLVNEIVGYEALVRWAHPRKGLLAPGQFVPQAEVTGAVDAIGAWALAEACRAAAEAPWLQDLTVAVNVSVRELRDPGYSGRLGALLDRHGVAPERLVLEITEAAFEDDHAQVLVSLRGVRALGVRIAIDDFGVGYSSLRRLGTMPLDILKIDGSFIDAIPHGSAEAPLLEAIVAMGRALGAQVIAERVENDHQALVLQLLGCELAQGYLFGRPCPPEAWTAA